GATGAPGEGAGGAILSDVTCTIPAGRVTLVAGLSGAGKTTLCDLVTGLIEPDRGAVLIDGQPAGAAQRAGLAEVLAYVGQEPFLTEATLRENLAWGAQGGPADTAAMAGALAAVGAGPLLAGLAHGLDTPLGAEAQRLSGGERQRIRLARALLRHPRLVVLDEATNALDAAAEADVLRALRRALPGATFVIVSHRPAVLGLADHVIWLEAGRVVEEGDAARLSAEPSSHTAIWRMLARG
ncbi:MAG: ABC transporter ATP-binding protein, partial [Thermohalobaculum sp.]|nr:ABC transporter ATP-binding protein [Thermohalobaculum sp.]